MRALFKLNPRRETEYADDYNHNVRGLLYNQLEELFPEAHGDNKQIPFTFSNLFPPREVLSDETKLIVACHRRDYLSAIASGISAVEEVNIGEMPFWVDDVSVFDVSPDDSGTLRSEHGVYCTVESPSEHPTYWREEHGVDEFRKQIEASLDWKIDKFTQYDSSNRSFPVFDSLSCQRTFARPVTVEAGSEITVVLSDWEFDYTIRSDMHRSYINLALDTGIGWKNTLGFGFVNQPK